MNDDFDDDMSDEEIDAVVQAAIGELLNLTVIAAAMQTTDDAAEDIYALCYLVSEYHCIERAKIITEENPDGSYTTRFEDPDAAAEPTATTTSIPGSIRTRNRPKFRVSDDKNNSNK